MLRAGKGGPDPLVVAGLTEGNIDRLRNGHPIHAPLKTFVPGMTGDILIFYGPTHADLESQIADNIVPGSRTSSDPAMEQQEAIFRDEKKILVCTVGLPQSGKSTWAKSQSWPTVNPDSIRLAIHGQRFIAEAEPFVWAVAKTMVRALFLAGHRVVILDATNTTKKRRLEWFDDAWTTYFKVFQTTSGDCKMRAQKNDRADLFPIIDRMLDHWEPLDESCKLWPNPT